MSFEPETMIFFTSISTLVASVVSGIISLRNRKAIQEIHLSINGRLSELIRKSEEAAHAIGKEEGVAKGEDNVTKGI